MTASKSRDQLATLKRGLASAYPVGWLGKLARDCNSDVGLAVATLRFPKGRVAVLLAAIAGLSWIDNTLGSEVPIYRAVYEVERNGKSIGTSEWTVTHDPERGLYRFNSSFKVKGMLRLLSPKPVVEQSDFIYENGEIVPLEFWYQDGSRRGEDNLHTRFDWVRGLAFTTSDGRSTELQLQPGILDRGSIHVAFMLDMLSSAGPGGYAVADGDSVKLYAYSLDGTQVLNTALGSIETQAFTRQRQGSSRGLLLWVAPQLSFLPVRMEQQKNGRTEMVFILQSVEGL